MNTSELTFTKYDTEIVFNHIYSTYKSTNIELAEFSTTQLNTGGKYASGVTNTFKGVFDETIGKWYTGSADIDLKTDSKPVDSWYYLVIII